jgi:HK97 family phage major capsid protein
MARGPRRRDVSRGTTARNTVFGFRRKQTSLDRIRTDPISCLIEKENIMGSTTELLQKRAALVADARKIVNLADSETRDNTAEEREKFDVMMAEADTIKADVERLFSLEQAESDLEASQGRAASIEVPTDRGTPRVIQLRKNVCGDERSIEIPGGQEAEDKLDGMRAALLRAFGITDARGTVNVRALSKGTDSEGGYLSPPLEFMAELIKAIDDIVYMREICRVLPPLTDASTLGAPTIDTDMDDADWTTELAIGDEDTGLAFGRRELTPVPLAKWIKISKTLLRRSTMPVDTIVRDAFARKFAYALENGYLNGSGTGQPLGVFTASASGVPVSRDVDEDNTTTAFTYDGLINCQMAVKKQYRRGASWIMHRDAVKFVRKLKDNDGRYLWIPSIMPGVPDTLLGDPLRESEYAPNTFTAGLYVGIYGDFSTYWIVDALTLTIQVLVELYAGTNQAAYLARLETDGAPTDPNAFARVKLADS